MNENYLQYIKWCEHIKHFVALVIIIIFFLIGDNELTFLFGSLLFINYAMFKKFKISQRITIFEIKRRLNKFPIRKDVYYSWYNNVCGGVFFIDNELKIMWYCGTQSKFSLYILPLNDIKITDTNYRLEITNEYSVNTLYVYKENM